MNDDIKKIIEDHQKWLKGEGEKRANLSESDLSGANLRWADLRGANLSGVKGLLNTFDYMDKHFESTSEGFIAYKTFNEHYDSPDHWEIKEGAVITEQVNPNRTEDCGCGVNVATRDWVKRNCNSKHDVWKVLIEWKWLVGVVVPYHTDGKIRCGRVRLLERVSLE